MQIGFLDVTAASAYLLGYELKLSKTELRLLNAIAFEGKTDTDSLLSFLSDNVGRGNVAVHISSINKKAERISGRKLIIFENSEYQINPFM